MKKYNPSLPFIKAGYDGNPVDNDGRYYHPQYPFELGWKDILKWKSRPNPYAEAKRKETWRPAVHKNNGFMKNSREQFVWLGHASFFMRLNGLNILTDPVFGKLSVLMPRYSELPTDPDHFTSIDYVLLTHDHRDHCDLPSLQLLAKNNPQAKVICGLGMTPVLEGYFKKENITEMGWYQRFSDERNGLHITYLPTRHWCRRYLFDLNVRLWGAYVLEADNKTIYFGGDSGYGDVFKETADLFPNINYAFLGIGAFAPKQIMQSNHMGPADAFKAFNDLRADHFIPMHYGTFDLSDEPLGEPWRLLKGIHSEQRLNGEVVFAGIGEEYGI